MLENVTERVCRRSLYVLLFTCLCFWRKGRQQYCKWCLESSRDCIRVNKKLIESILTDPSSLPLLYAHLLSDTWSKLHLPRAGNIINSWSGRSWVWGSCSTPDRCEGRKVSPMADNWNLHCSWSQIHRDFNGHPWARKVSGVFTATFSFAAAAVLPASLAKPALFEEDWEVPPLLFYWH